MPNKDTPARFWEDHILRWEDSRYSSLARLNPFAWTVRSRARHAVRALRPFLGQGCRILDLGCGGGHLLSLLRTEFPVSYLGVDFSARAIQKARSIRPSPGVRSEFEVVDLRENRAFTADVAVMLGLVDWFDLPEFAELLKPLRTEHLVLSFTERKEGISTFFYGLYRRFLGIRESTYRARSYSTAEIRTAVVLAGFEVLEIRAPFSMRPGKILIARRKGFERTLDAMRPGP